MLSDPFKVSVEPRDDEMEEEEGPDFIQERSELFPLILCFLTKDVKMFKELWNHQMLWNAHIYLILLANFVFETQSPDFIRSFLLSTKTKNLFNSISLCEKQKFLQFTIKSLEQQIVIGDESFDNDTDEKTREELEKILNVEMLSQTPYSLVNLTENLLPLNINSTVENLQSLIDQY